jgi:hypothetical protein
MAKHDELIIEQRSDKRWEVRKPHAERASAVKDTRGEAIAWAKEHAPEGDIKLKGSDGKFSQIQKS